MSTQPSGSRETSVAFVVPPSRVDYASAIETVLSDTTEEGSDVTHRFDARKPLPDPERFDVVVLTGSYAHVGDRDPWMDRLQRFARKRVDAKRPILGVCFGHQLLADALGGCVERLPTSAAGYERVSLTASGRTHPLFAEIPASFHTFLWHVDHVTRVPDGAAVLARADDTIQAFAMPDSPTVGIQFHPEVTPQMARTLAEKADDSSPPSTAVEESLTENRIASARSVRRIYRDFVARVGDSNVSNLSVSQTRK